MEKEKRQIKPQFIIDNEKITNRRVIANKFNKYFLSLATNINEAYNEIGELTVNSIPSFTDYLPNTNSSSIYLSDCTLEGVLNVISELQNGKSSDVSIHVVILVKASSQIISPVLLMLYDKCMNELVLISPIYKKDNEDLLEN